MADPTPQSSGLEIERLIAGLRAPSAEQDGPWFTPKAAYATKPRAMLDEAARRLEWLNAEVLAMIEFGQGDNDALARFQTRLQSLEVENARLLGEERDALARFLGSFPMHDEDRGPDNEVLIDQLPMSPDDDTPGETMLYRIVDALLARSHPPASGGEDLREKVIDDIAAERRRQVEAEGWTPDHDDHHDKNELACAAAAYALRSADCDAQARMAWGFTRWGASWFKPNDNDPRRMLVKAGALIVAEIERLDRLALHPSSRGEAEQK